MRQKLFFGGRDQSHPEEAAGGVGCKSAFRGAPRAAPRAACARFLAVEHACTASNQPIGARAATAVAALALQT